MKLIFFAFIISISSWAKHYNPKLSTDSYFINKTYSKKQLENFATEWANHFKLDVSIVHSVITQESSWNHIARSHKDAIGLMQLLPTTAKDSLLGMSKHESLYNPYTNIYYGTKYLRWLLDRYIGDYALALVGYYSGPKWADYLRDKKLKNPRFKKQIVSYANQVLERSESIGVNLVQKVEAQEAY